MVRVGLATILDAEPSIEVVGQARDGLEAVERVRSLRPDVCLFDIRMPQLDGIEATRLVAGPEVADPVPVIVITTFDEDQYVYDALRAGARGFLLKDADPELLARAVHAAASGDALISPAVTARLLATFTSGRPAQAAEPVDPLTPREEAVLDLVAAGSEHDDVDEQVRRFAASYFSRFLCVFSLSLFRSTVVLSLFSFDCRCAFRSPGCRCASPDRMIFGGRSAARRTVFRIIS